MSIDNKLSTEWTVGLGVPGTSTEHVRRAPERDQKESRQVPSGSSVPDCLAGIRVLELSHGWSAGALCGRLLADLGARVTKVEGPQADPAERLGPRSSTGRSYLGRSLTFGKTIERLSATDGYHPRIDELVLEHDVVIVDDWWARQLPYGRTTSWRNKKPGLIGCTTSYFGQGNGYSTNRSSELTAQSMWGLITLTGHPQSAPVRAGVPLSAVSSALIAASAVMAALYRRSATGLGAWIDNAESDAVMMMHGNFLPGYLTKSIVPTRAGNSQPVSAPWNAYPTSDGEIVIVAISEALWSRLLTVIGRDDLIGDPHYAGVTARVNHRDEVDALIRTWTSMHTTEAVRRALDEARIPAGEARSLTQAIHDATERDCGMIAYDEVDTPVLGSFVHLRDNDTTQSTPTSLRSSHREWIVSNSPRQPLAGIRVLELGGHTAGGLSTRLLADLGADVIKVESPNGDEARRTVPVLSDGSAYLWHSWNVGKRSVVIDASTPDGYGRLLNLVRTADVVVENLAAETLDKLAIGYADLAPVNPALIYCGISGFGLWSNQRYRRAFDSIIQAEAALMHLTGLPGDAPVKIGSSAADNLTALAAAGVVLAALHRRNVTGTGSCADVSLLDVAVWATAEWWPLVWAGEDPTRMGDRHPYHPLHNSFVSSDGVRLSVAAVEIEHVDAARLLFGLTDDSSTWDAAVRTWIESRTSTESINACQSAGIPIAAQAGLDDVVGHPLMTDRRMLDELVIGPGERCMIIGSPYKFDGEPTMRARRRSTPGIGEHTQEILGGEAFALPGPPLSRTR
jgi:crotonobetainyl-CoA:carnitine CoA-transferase CaiB-like acyl-CoA transferase